MGKKPVYKVIRGFDMNTPSKNSKSIPHSNHKRDEESYYANKNQFSDLKPEDIAQPEGRVLRGL